MRRQTLEMIAIFLVSFLLVSPARAQEPGNDVARWDFNVFLNDKKVGEHQFVVSEANGSRQVRSEASFLYKILFYRLTVTSTRLTSAGPAIAWSSLMPTRIQMASRYGFPENNPPQDLSSTKGTAPSRCRNA